MLKTQLDICYTTWISQIIKVALAWLFLWSGFYKILDLQGFMDIVVGYTQIADTLYKAEVITIAMPIIEILIGMAWLLPTARIAAISTVIVNTGFVIAIAMHWGQPLNCGCLPGSEIEIVGYESFYKNGLIFLSIIILIIIGKNRDNTLTNAT